MKKKIEWNSNISGFQLGATLIGYLYFYLIHEILWQKKREEEEEEKEKKIKNKREKARGKKKKKKNIKKKKKKRKIKLKKYICFQ